MIVTCVHVHVKFEKITEFIQACRENHYKSIQEKGNIRFDVLQNAEDPEKFLLYEAYENDEAAAAHKKTEHYLVWRDKVADWMAQPRQGVPYKILFPLQSEI
jgi:(4S)-4-hydroxy-5-phosphonooxypentane-2,3-dione isomerase